MRKTPMLAALIGTLAFCGCKKEEGGAGAPREVNLWVMPNSTKPQQDVEALVEKFAAAHPGVTVRVSVLDWAGAWTKLTTAAIGGDGPDVVQLGTTWCASMTDMGALLPLDDLVDSVHARSAFLAATWESVKPRNSEHATSLPWFLDVRPVFYRTDLFTQAGVDAGAIKTWEQYASALRKIRDAKFKHEGASVAAAGFTGKNDWNVVHNFAPWIWGAGGDFLNAAGDKCTLDSPESMAGILFFLDLVRQKVSPRENMEKNTAQVAADFQAGRLATFAGPTNQVTYFSLTPEQGGIANSPLGKNYGVLAPPAGPKSDAVFMGGSHLAVFKSSRQPELAKELIRYLTADSSAQISYAEMSGFLPALKKALDDPLYTQDDKGIIFRGIAERGRAYASVPYWAEIETAVLMKRLGNLYDLAAEANGPYSEAAVRAEVAATVKDINGIIREHLAGRPAAEADKAPKAEAAASAAAGT